MAEKKDKRNSDERQNKKSQDKIKKASMSKENGKNDENTKKSQFYVKAIIFVAIVVIAVASIWVFDKWQTENQIDEFKKKQGDNFSQYLDSIAGSAGETKEKVNKNLVGTYKSYGYDNEAVVELHEDCTVSVVSTGAKGWWSSTERDGIEVVAMMFEGTSEPEYFQVYGNRFLDTRSIYFGKVSSSSRFNSELTMGDMTITLKDNGKAEGRFRQTVTENDVEYPYSEAYSGRYTVDSEFIEITLGGDVSRFLMFDYGDDSLPSGIASLYYEKID